MLKARLSSGITTELSVGDDISQLTVRDLKELIHLACGEELEGMRLVVRGRILQDDEMKLSAYAVTATDTVHVAKTKIISPVSPQPKPAKGDDMDGLMANPMIQMIMSNPQFMQSIIQSDPRIKEMIAEHPEIRQAMTDPAFLAEISQAARNPRLRQEMMRNQDRAISNVESMPGGFNQLSSMFKSMSGPSTSSDPSTEEANRKMARRMGVLSSPTNGGPNEEALPNPWAPQKNSNYRLTTVRAVRSATSSIPTSSPIALGLPTNLSRSAPSRVEELEALMNFRNQLNPSIAPVNSLLPRPPTITTQTISPGGVPLAPVEVRYESQLLSLRQMGFTNEEQNKKAVLACGGNVDLAVSFLLGRLVRSWDSNCLANLKSPMVFVSFEGNKSVFKVKTTPATSIQSIIDQACVSFNLNPNGFVLTSNRKPIQSSLSFRLAGVDQNAKLVLVYKGVSLKSQKVSVAIQTEESGRLVSDFDSSASLWDLLRHFEDLKSLNLTRQSGVPPKRNLIQFANTAVYIMPVIIFMNKEYSTIPILKSTSLRSMGLDSGSAAVRLLSRYTDQPLKHFISQIEQVIIPSIPEVNTQVLEPELKEVIRKDSKIQTIDSGEILPAIPIEKASNLPLIAEPLEREGILGEEMEVSKELPEVPVNKEMPIIMSFEPSADTIEMDEEQLHQPSAQRPIVEPDIKVYQPPLDGSNALNIQLPPSFYNVTSKELKVLFESQKQQTKALENRPLMTARMRERERILKEQKHIKTMIRVKFPDRFMFEITLYSGCKVEELFHIINESVARRQPFRLFTTPPQVDLDPSKTFWSHGLSPATLVHLVWDPQEDTSGQHLSSQMLEKSIRYPTAPEELLPDEVVEEIVQDLEEVEVEPYRPTPKQQEKPRDKSLPKWFRP